MEYKYTSIILEKRNKGETDRFYVFYTLEKGKIGVKAQGVRRPQSKLAGNLENFNFGHIFVARGKGSGRIIGAIAENIFPALRKNWETLSSVFETIAIFNRLTDYEEKDVEIFKLLLEYLFSMEKVAAVKEISSEETRKRIKILKSGFLIQFLLLSGYRLETKTCVVCGEKIAAEGNYFSSPKGGLICSRCSMTVSRKIAISANTIKLVRLFSYHRLSSFLKLKVGDKEIENLELVVRDFLRWII